MPIASNLDTDHVMELVRGVSITRFCEEHRHTTRGRLELFLEFCGAVQHAHQKGIIHRDPYPITPNNPDVIWLFSRATARK
jgi:serine/threonine protein kinase